MAKDSDNSLGEQRSFEGGARTDTDPQSLGDQETLGNANSSSPDLSNLDEIEIVDLAARYTIEGTLGKGGMGEVLLAFDTRLKRKVAIKRVLNELAGSGSALNRFLTEAQSIAALNHTNIVQIHDYGRDKDGPFLILEYVDGSTLLECCQKGALPIREAIELTCQLCDGLSSAHDADIIHRDIKPANVLLTKAGVPKLTDFGLARDETADTGMTRMGTVLGTLDFMPPEQRRDPALTDTRSDLWSLAATLYQMVTGKSPRVIKLNNLPQSLQDVMGKALEDDKDDRYQNAGEFCDALQSCLGISETTTDTITDLRTGECAECHTGNPSDHKFCRECAAPLRTRCLKCKTEIPIWDKACGECGGKQAALASTLQNGGKQSDRTADTVAHYATGYNLAPGRKVATIETNRGTIRLLLYADRVPSTVANFEKLANDGFYNGLVFHRVIDDFMIQTGCPQGTGRGDPGYQFADEFDSELKHDRPGILSMANSGPNTNGSQFFITHVPTPWLNGIHAVFGAVIEGQDVVNSIVQGDKMLNVSVSHEP